MKTQSKLLVVATAAILAGALGWNALAGTPTPGTSGGSSMHATEATGMGPEMMGCAPTNPAGSLTSIKQQLGITTAQEPAWEAYANSVRDTVASVWSSHYPAMNAMHDGADTQAVMSQMHDQRRQALRALRAAADKLVAALDDAQKQKAQEVLPGLTSGGHAMLVPGIKAE
jgi:hypothetical protein